MQTLQEFLQSRTGRFTGIYQPAPDSLTGTLQNSFSVPNREYDEPFTCEDVIGLIGEYLDEVRDDLQLIEGHNYGPLVICWQSDDQEISVGAVTKISISVSKRTGAVLVVEETILHVSL